MSEQMNDAILRIYEPQIRSAAKIRPSLFGGALDLSSEDVARHNRWVDEAPIEDVAAIIPDPRQPT